MNHDWHVIFTLYCEGISGGWVFGYSPEELDAAMKWDRARWDMQDSELERAFSKDKSLLKSRAASA